MKTFDINTNITDERFTFQPEQFRQDEAAWANKLFNNWFKDRQLAWGHDYYLSCCPGGNVLVCFYDVSEAMWFKSHHEAAA